MDVCIYYKRSLKLKLFHWNYKCDSNNIGASNPENNKSYVDDLVVPSQPVTMWEVIRPYHLNITSHQTKLNESPEKNKTSRLTKQNESPRMNQKHIQ